MAFQIFVIKMARLEEFNVNIFGDSYQSNEESLNNGERCLGDLTL